MPTSVRKKRNAITETFDRIYICLHKVPSPIAIPAACEILAVIRFLSAAKGVKAADIHREISKVCGENI